MRHLAYFLGETATKGTGYLALSFLSRCACAFLFPMLDNSAAYGTATSVAAESFHLFWPIVSVCSLSRTATSTRGNVDLELPEETMGRGKGSALHLHVEYERICSNHACLFSASHGRSENVG